MKYIGARQVKGEVKEKVKKWNEFLLLTRANFLG